MKLRESRVVQRRQQLSRAGELLGGEEEHKDGFNPDIHLKPEDWEKATERLAEWKLGNTLYALTLWMQQHHLNPQLFWQSVQSGPVGDWFKTFTTPAGQEKIVEKITYQLLASRPKHILEEFSHRAEARDLFPYHDFTPTDQKRSDLFLALRSNRRLLKIESVINALFLIQQFPGPTPNFTQDSPSDYSPHLTAAERNQFLEQWQEVWGTGRLEDVVPDKLVSMLAKIRVVDPELYEMVQLDHIFWVRALDWVDELRESGDTRSLFEFSFHLNMLSAEKVSLDEHGKLLIERSGKQQKAAPLLPNREMI